VDHAVLADFYGLQQERQRQTGFCRETGRGQVGVGKPVLVVELADRSGIVETDVLQVQEIVVLRDRLAFLEGGLYPAHAQRAGAVAHHLEMTAVIASAT